MQQADQLLKSGDIAGARALLVQTVRERPDDVGARMFLAQLMLVAGEWDKAESQLRALAQTSAETQMLATAYSQAIAAEKKRALAFAGKGAFEPLLSPDSWLKDLAASLGAYAKGAVAEGEELRGRAFDAVPEISGAWNGTPFTQIADCDGRFGPAFEAIVAGHWGLLAFDEVVSIKSEGPQDLRDIVWLPVEMTFRTGQSAAGFLPVRYPGTETAGDDQLRLARATQWRDGPSGQEGIGQRLLFLDDGSEHGLLALRHLTVS